MSARASAYASIWRPKSASAKIWQSREADMPLISARAAMAAMSSHERRTSATEAGGSDEAKRLSNESAGCEALSSLAVQSAYQLERAKPSS